MDSNTAIYIIVLAVLVMLSAFFSASETAFTSSNLIRLKSLADNGNKKARFVLKLLDNFDKLLSAILIGNNIVNIVASSIATVVFVTNLGDIGVTMSTIVMTLLILTFGEITPKTLAKKSPEKVAMLVAPILHKFMILFTPISCIFTGIKKLIEKIGGVKDDQAITEDEFMAFVDEATEDGSIDENESELIHNVMDFGDREAVDIMTPRVNVHYVRIDDSVEKIASVFRESGKSRLPVCEDSLDNIKGVIFYKDFYNYIYGQKTSVESIIKKPMYITQYMSIRDMLEMFQRTKMHIAFVTDEFGGIYGIVTMEDVLEELVGEIWDEHDKVVEEITEVSENRYKVDCNTSFDKFLDFFEIECDEDYPRVGGFVAGELGKLPKVGDVMEYENLKIEVIKADDKKVQEVLVTRFPKPEEDD